MDERKATVNAHSAVLRRRRGYLAALAASSIAAQAAYGDHRAADVPTAELGASLVTDGGSFDVEIRSMPDPIRLNEYFDIVVHIRSHDGATRSGQALVDVDARMPQHEHGMNTRPQRRRVTEGEFVFMGMLLHMAGDWEIRIGVAQGRIRESALAQLRIE